MFALGQEAGDEVDQKTQAIQSAAEMRDQLFDENQGKAIKTILGVVVGMYIIYRFLLK
jgi:hypothetical protein